MKSFLELLYIVVLGLTVGAALSWFSIQKNHGFGALEIGEWTAWPLAGSQDADPYTKAKTAAEGEVPLGAAEGLAFHASNDSRGNALQRHCQYRLSGTTPPGRFWSLTAHLLEDAKPDENSPISRGMLSQTLLRNTNGQLEIHVGPTFSQGNWLQVEGRGPYRLILRLYDSPITSATGLVDLEMLKIEQMDCSS